MPSPPLPPKKILLENVDVDREHNNGLVSERILDLVLGHVLAMCHGLGWQIDYGKFSMHTNHTFFQHAECY